MKKSLLLVFALLMVSGAFAQRYERNILSVRGGMNIASQTLKEDGVSLDLDSRVGFHVGVSDQILLTKSMPLYLETGLYFSQMGAKYDGAVDRPMYLQIPVLVNYHFNIKNKVELIPYAGLAWGIGICGKAESDEGLKVDYFGNDVVKRCDLGVRLGVGVEWHKIYFGLGYDIGCMNILKANEDLVKAHNNCFSLTVGYHF